MNNQLTTRKDAAEEISDVKFSPNSAMAAVGSHDNYIYLYAPLEYIYIKLYIENDRLMSLVLLCRYDCSLSPKSAGPPSEVSYIIIAARYSADSYICVYMCIRGCVMLVPPQAVAATERSFLIYHSSR